VIADKMLSSKLFSSFFLAVVALAAQATAAEVATKAPKAAVAACTTPVDFCTCPNKEYVVSPIVAAFYLHQAFAFQQGCQLATAGDQAELDLISAALQANPPDATANSDGQPLAWIGFARPLTEPTSWVWLDGCANFDTSFFATGASPAEPNANGPVTVGDPNQEPLGGIWYSTDPTKLGQLGNIPQYYQLPAVYECCVAPTPSTKAPKAPSRRRALRR
jgi:hypothetical protein